MFSTAQKSKIRVLARSSRLLFNGIFPPKFLKCLKYVLQFKGIQLIQFIYQQKVTKKVATS